MCKETCGRVNSTSQMWGIYTDMLTLVELFVPLHQLREITALYKSAADELKMKNKSMLYHEVHSARANQCLQNSLSLFFWYQVTPKNPDVIAQSPLLLEWSQNPPFRPTRCCSIWRMYCLYHRPKGKRKTFPVEIHGITGLPSDTDVHTKWHWPCRATEVYRSIPRPLSWMWTLW